MTEDALQQDSAFADAADRRGELRPQLGQGDGRRLRRHRDALRVGRGGPDPQGVGRGLPRHVVRPYDDIPDSLREHLRYPEDLFKAQRYQFQRYHVTDAQLWFEGSEPLGGAQGPAGHQLAAAALPPLHRRRRVADLVADLGLRVAEARQARRLHGGQQRRHVADYGKISVKELPDEGTDGPRLIANQLQHERRGPRPRCCPTPTVTPTSIHGNLLTLPVGDDFMYVQPLYTRRKNESAFPILTFVLVSYKGNVGIGTTLSAAIEDSLDGSSTPGTPTEEPTETPTESPTASPSESPDRVADDPAPGRHAGPDPRPAPAGRGEVHPGRRGAARRQQRQVGPADGGGSRPDRGGRAAGRLTPIWESRTAPVMFCSPTRGGAAR